MASGQGKGQSKEDLSGNNFRQKIEFGPGAFTISGAVKKIRTIIEGNEHTDTQCIKTDCSSKAVLVAQGGPHCYLCGFKFTSKSGNDPLGPQCEHIISCAPLALLCGLSTPDYEKDIKFILERGSDQTGVDSFKLWRKRVLGFSPGSASVNYREGGHNPGGAYKWAHGSTCNSLKDNDPYLRLMFDDKEIKFVNKNGNVVTNDEEAICDDTIKWLLTSLSGHNKGFKGKGITDGGSKSVRWRDGIKGMKDGEGDPSDNDKIERLKLYKNGDLALPAPIPWTEWCEERLKIIKETTLLPLIVNIKGGLNQKNYQISIATFRNRLSRKTTDTSDEPKGIKKVKGPKKYFLSAKKLMFKNKFYEKLVESVSKEFKTKKGGGRVMAPMDLENEMKDEFADEITDKTQVSSKRNREETTESEANKKLKGTKEQAVKEYLEENKTNAIKEASDDYDLTEGEIQEIFSIDEFKEYYNIEDFLPPNPGLSVAEYSDLLWECSKHKNEQEYIDFYDFFMVTMCGGDPVPEEEILVKSERITKSPLGVNKTISKKIPKRTFGLDRTNKREQALANQVRSVLTTARAKKTGRKKKKKKYKRTKKPKRGSSRKRKKKSKK